MCKKIVILISTRKYLPNSKNFEDIQSNSLDEFVTRSNILNEDDLMRIRQNSNGNIENKNQILSQQKRYKVWHHRYASYQEYNYPVNGLKIRKTCLIDKETSYIIYIAPCTSGIDDLGLEYRKNYTQKLTEIVKNDLGDAHKYYLVAHDKDVSEFGGSGICSPVNFFHTYKFQHEDDDEMYQKINEAINEPSVTTCIEICSIIDAALENNEKMFLLSQL